MERTFALYSPNLSSIKIVRAGKVRRAKLYYLRDRKGKSARIAEKIKKKIGIDISVKNEEVTNDQVLNTEPVVKQQEIEENKNLEKTDNKKSEEKK